MKILEFLLQLTFCQWIGFLMVCCLAIGLILGALQITLCSCQNILVSFFRSIGGGYRKVPKEAPLATSKPEDPQAPIETCKVCGVVLEDAPVTGQYCPNDDCDSGKAAPFRKDKPGEPK